MITGYKKIFIMIACLSFCSSHMQASWWPTSLTRIVTKALRSLKGHPWITGTCAIGALATCRLVYKRLMGHRQPQAHDGHHQEGHIAPTPTPVRANQTHPEQLPIKRETPITRRQRPLRQALNHPFVQNGLIRHKKDYRLAVEPNPLEMRPLELANRLELDNPVADTPEAQVGTEQVQRTSILAWRPCYFAPTGSQQIAIGSIVVACLIPNAELNGYFAHTMQQFASYVARGYGKPVHLIFFSWTGNSLSCQFAANVAQFMADNVHNIGGISPDIWTVTQGQASTALDLFAKRIAGQQQSIHTAIHFGNVTQLETADANIRRLYHLYSQPPDGAALHLYAPIQVHQEVHNILVQFADDAHDHELRDQITPETLTSLLFDVDSHYKKQTALNAYCPTAEPQKAFPLVTLTNLEERFDPTSFAYHTMRQTMAFQKYGVPLATAQPVR